MRAVAEEVGAVEEMAVVEAAAVRGLGLEGLTSIAEEGVMTMAAGSICARSAKAMLKNR